MQDVTKFAKFLKNKSKVGQKTYIKTRYGLVSVNIKPQKDYLNMNPTCSACLCVNEWRRCAVSFTTHTEVHMTLAVLSASATSIYMSTWTHKHNL